MSWFGWITISPSHNLGVFVSLELHFESPVPFFIVVLSITIVLCINAISPLISFLHVLGERTLIFDIKNPSSEAMWLLEWAFWVFPVAFDLWLWHWCVNFPCFHCNTPFRVPFVVPFLGHLLPLFI